MLPDYWIARPSPSPSRATLAAVEEFLSSHAADVDALLTRHATVEPWHFLCGVADRRRFAFHGTGDGGIESFEPRRPVDLAPFGDQQAVFATSDPIWAMFYAIVDRGRFEITLNNGCIVLLDENGEPAGLPHYYFSISRDALPERPWRSGYVYFLPADTFVEQPSGEYGGQLARVPQLASPVPVTPFARLRVEPEDFPFLAQVRGHEDERLGEYARAVMTAGRWPD